MRDALGVGLAVGTYGVAFGAAGAAAGLSVLQCCALSMLAFTGASQFALVGVLGAGGGVIPGVAGALLLGARNGLYGLRLATTLGYRGPRRLLAAHGVIDETTAVTVAQPDPASARIGFWVTFGSIWSVWNLTTLAGALGATALGEPGTFGLDAVVPAAFLALLWPRLTGGGRERWVALVGAAVAVAATPWLPPGVPVLLASVAVLAGVRR